MGKSYAKYKGNTLRSRALEMDCDASGKTVPYLGKWDIILDALGRKKVVHDKSIWYWMWTCYIPLLYWIEYYNSTELRAGNATSITVELNI